MLAPKKNKIPSQLHHYPERELGPVKSHHLHLKDHLIIKFSPKYYKSWPIETHMKPRKVWVLKRMKKISFVKERDSKFCSKNLWRTILQNKFKCVDVYDHNHSHYEENNISRYKAFSKITKIKLFDESESHNSLSRQMKKLPSLAWILSRNLLPGMSNLKFLSIEIKSENDFYLLEKVNLLTNILPALKTLRIESPVRKKSKDRVTILPCLFKNQNILKYVIHLSLGRLAEEESWKMFKLLPKHCKNLNYLSFEVCENQSFHLSDPYTHANYLNVLSDFNKLEGLRISVHDTLAFMEHFTILPSLKFLHISFLDSSWYEICQELFARSLVEFNQDPHKDWLFNDTERTRTFSDNFFKFKSLVSLEFSAQDAPDAAQFILSFITSLLPGISSKLQNLQFNLLDFRQKDTPLSEPSPFSPKDFLYLSSKLFTSLKTLKISFPKYHSVNLGNEEAKGIHFFQLSSFEFSGRIFHAAFQNILNMAKKRLSLLQQINNVNSGNISFKISLPPTEIFELFKILLKNLPRNSQVKMLLLLDLCDKEEEVKQIEEFVEKAKGVPIVQNVELTFEINDNSSIDFQKSLSLLSQVFGKVSFKENLRRDFDDDEENNEERESFEESKTSQSEFSEDEVDIKKFEGGENEVQKAGFGNEEKEICVVENKFLEEEK